MLTVETTQVDAFVQDICKDTTLPVKMRGMQGAAAISVHVAQEFGLLIGQPLYVDMNEVDHLAGRLAAEGQAALADLRARSGEAQEWLSLQVSNPGSPGVFYVTDETLPGGEGWGLPKVSDLKVSGDEH